MVCEEIRAQGVFSSSASHTLVYKGLLCRRAFEQSEIWSLSSWFVKRFERRVFSALQLHTHLYIKACCAEGRLDSQRFDH